MLLMVTEALIKSSRSLNIMILRLRVGHPRSSQSPLRNRARDGIISKFS